MHRTLALLGGGLLRNVRPGATEARHHALRIAHYAPSDPEDALAAVRRMRAAFKLEPALVFDRTMHHVRCPVAVIRMKDRREGLERWCRELRQHVEHPIAVI